MSKQGFDAWWENARQSWTAIEGDLAKDSARLAYAAGQAAARWPTCSKCRTLLVPYIVNEQGVELAWCSGCRAGKAFGTGEIVSL